MSEPATCISYGEKYPCTLEPTLVENIQYFLSQPATAITALLLTISLIVAGFIAYATSKGVVDDH